MLNKPTFETLLCLLLIVSSSCGTSQTLMQQKDKKKEEAIKESLEKDGAVDLLSVSGTINLDTREVDFTNTASLPAVKNFRTEPGDFDLVAENKNGDELHKESFEISRFVAEGDDPNMASFRVALAPQTKQPIAKMRVLRNGKELASKQGSESIPTVTIENPQAVSISDGVTFEWQGLDEDEGSELIFSVMFTDDGTRWRSLGVETTANSATLRNPEWSLRPTQAGKILVSVSDGVNASYSYSDSFIVTE